MFSADVDDEDDDDNEVDGNFTFVLLAQCVTGKRPLVLIQSTNMDTKKVRTFVAYQSNSQCGTWRHYQMNSRLGQIYKGPDYATTTMLATNIQKLIYEGIQTAPQKSEIEISAHQHAISRGNDKRRLPDALKVMTTFRCGEAFVGANPIQDTKNPALLRFMSDRYDTIDERLRDYPRFLSGIMEANFTVVPNTLKYICTYSYKLWDIDFTDNKLYTLTLRPKSNAAPAYTLELSYITYQYNEKMYNIPINLVHSSDHVRWHGMLAKFVSVGLYLCKPMEYTHQCTLLDKKGRCVGEEQEYYFIGDHMTGMWPLEQIDPKPYNSAHDYTNPTPDVQLAIIDFVLGDQRRISNLTKCVTYMKQKYVPGVVREQLLEYAQSEYCIHQLINVDYMCVVHTSYSREGHTREVLFGILIVRERKAVLINPNGRGSQEFVRAAQETLHIIDNLQVVSGYTDVPNTLLPILDLDVVDVTTTTIELKDSPFYRLCQAAIIAHRRLSGDNSTTITTQNIIDFCNGFFAYATTAGVLIP